MTYLRIVFAGLIAGLIAGLMFLLFLEFEPEWPACETDAECADMYGDDGGPEPYPLED